MSFKIPAFFHMEKDTMRTRSARVHHIQEAIELNPKGFRQASKKRPWELTYLGMAMVLAGMSKPPVMTLSKRGVLKRKKKEEFLAACKANPNQHRSNWQRSHRGELRKDTIARYAAGAVT